MLRPMDLMVEATPRRVFANAHTYHINSISVNSDYETYMSADDLRINLWNFEITNQSFSILGCARPREGPRQREHGGASAGERGARTCADVGGRMRKPDGGTGPQWRWAAEGGTYGVRLCGRRRSCGRVCRGCV